jgi:DNA invertase Pin-like site-specific DNA recombinase
VGLPAAIYCRISQAYDDDQSGVDRQERLCRDVAQRFGLQVGDGLVFVDNNRSAWKRNRRRAGWDALLQAARDGVVRHIIAYHPDRLMRQPRDLEDLLTVADEASITLHGQANRRDLSDPDDRFFLRIEVAHACRSSDDTSRRLKDAMVDRARDGKPHVGKRRYGYGPDGMRPDPDEARVVREIFARYLDGHSPRTIAADLNARGVPPVDAGKVWEAWRVLGVLDCRHVAAIQVFRGEEIGPGDWEAIIDAGTWAEVRDRRTFRADAHKARSAPTRAYLLRGLVFCKRCGNRMNGTATGKTARVYQCNRIGRHDDTRCVRGIGAVRLEAFVVDAAVHVLENLSVGDGPDGGTSPADEAANSADDGELAELKAMWNAGELKTREYRAMRATIEARIRDRAGRRVVRPTAQVLAGFTGPAARTAFDNLIASGDLDRANALLRFLFAAVIIDANTTPGTFDYTRIQIEPNPL